MSYESLLFQERWQDLSSEGHSSVRQAAKIYENDHHVHDRSLRSADHDFSIYPPLPP